VTLKEAFERVLSGERFDDTDILSLANSSGWTIAHSQACRGWTTLDLDILSLTGRDGETVLDVMLRYGWKPKTEEEKLIVFTVKAGV